MRVEFLSENPQKDPLIGSVDIPGHFQQYVLKNAISMHFKASYHEYLEQRYISQECVMCWLNFKIHKNGDVIPITNQQMLVLVIVMRGVASCYLHGFGNFVAEQGNIYPLYIPAGARNSVTFDEGEFDVVYYCISQSYLEHMAKQDEDVAHLVASFKSRSSEGFLGKIAPVNQFVLNELDKVKDCEEEFQESNLRARGHDLVMHYIKNAGRKFTGRFTDVLTKSEKIKLAKKIIDEQEAGKLTIDEIAKKVGMSKQQLCRGFKEKFGFTIGEYDTNRRFNRACQLLRETDMLLAEVSEKIGYTDQTSLTRLFRTKLKITPQEYQKNSKKLL